VPHQQLTVAFTDYFSSRAQVPVSRVQRLMRMGLKDPVLFNAIMMQRVPGRSHNVALPDREIG
jgi:hypothetical protein